jgi:CO/xanthine dehydrogenase Mo-binding subunit
MWATMWPWWWLKRGAGQKRGRAGRGGLRGAARRGRVTQAAKAEALHDIAPDNHCYKWAIGDKGQVDAAFAQAAHVTKLDLVNNRLIPNAMEPRAAIGSYSRATEEYTLYVSNQNPHVERLLMTAFVMGLPEHKVRVIAPDVGGGFRLQDLPLRRRRVPDLGR